MKVIAENLATGRACVAQICIATAGLTASFTLKDWLQAFAALATGIYFLTATLLAIRNRNRERTRSPFRR